MDRAVLLDALLDLFNEETGASLTTLGDDVPLNGLGLDSVDTFSLVMQIERQFRIRFSNDELGRIEDVSNLLDLIALKLQQQSTNRAA